MLMRERVGLWNRQVTGDLEKAYQTLELWAQAYPRAAPQPLDPRELMAGLSTRGTGRFEGAAEQAKKTIENYPNVSIGYGALTQSSIFLDRLDEAENALQLAASRTVGQQNFPAFQYTIAFLKDDEEQIRRAVALA